MEFPLFETIALENGQIRHIEEHQRRYLAALANYYPNRPITRFDLSSLIRQAPQFNELRGQKGLFRCRIDYNAQDFRLSLTPYQRRIHRRFQPVRCDNIDYALKYADRDLLNLLLQQRGDCDEIIIIKGGCVTDCSIGNLAFRCGKDWFTPDTPLLKGVQRSILLAQRKIRAVRILHGDLDRFDEIRIINAMNPL
ncbi:4-amino-4-deoxychorismate lyase [Mesocricetibacter intestinalis]|uniref:4-amino-4-deoxychorismate lyase n=1 Tax=Mesocricetibacter intestinalis TaxID=1521930 RepID=A0A4R6V6C7_9PAST|nr:aminotransferase class IV family protein [Mesocricetibacter intestinalis]TDQ56512.1 4-amino-4-deoxychorismate lyase [Mesocricetibacter intestinalis]